MEFGLEDKHKKILKDIFHKYLSKARIIVYGSRAKGNFQKESDLDLIIADANTYNRQILADIQEEIIESDFPLLVDIQYMEDLTNEELVAHINRAGQEFIQIK